jgi:hypothetical protein
VRFKSEQPTGFVLNKDSCGFDQDVAAWQEEASEEAGKQGLPAPADVAPLTSSASTQDAPPSKPAPQPAGDSDRAPAPESSKLQVPEPAESLRIDGSNPVTAPGTLPDSSKQAPVSGPVEQQVPEPAANSKQTSSHTVKTASADSFNLRRLSAGKVSRECGVALSCSSRTT